MGGMEINPFIQNVSYEDIKNGNHFNPGNQSVLIQIVDNDSEFPIPKHEFSEIYKFKFLDIEENDLCIDESFRFSDKQAEDIAFILIKSLDKSMNVIVHCHMGICRSGAVAEIGTILGFRDTDTFRCPNLLVKHKLMNVLGMYYR